MITKTRPKTSASLPMFVSSKTLRKELKMFKHVIASAAAALALTAAWAQNESGPNSPFFVHPTALRHAYALDLLGIQADVTRLNGGEHESNQGPAAQDDQAEDEESLVGTALQLLGGSLGKSNMTLFEGVREAFTKAERGEPVAPATLSGLLRRAERALIPPALEADTAFQADRIALLLTLEPGVAEAYDAAANGSPESYLVGYAGLRRAESEYQSAKTNLVGEKTDIDRAFRVLGALMAGPDQPARYSDPADAELAVTDVAVGLETLTRTTLIPRDLASLLDVINAHVQQGCADATAGRTGLALEWGYAASFFYASYVADTVGVLAAPSAARIEKDLAIFLDDPKSRQTPRLCHDVSDAIADAKSIFGG